MHLSPVRTWWHPVVASRDSWQGGQAGSPAAGRRAPSPHHPSPLPTSCVIAAPVPVYAATVSRLSWAVHVLCGPGGSLCGIIAHCRCTLGHMASRRRCVHRRRRPLPRPGARVRVPHHLKRLVGVKRRGGRRGLVRFHDAACLEQVRALLLRDARVRKPAVARG